MYKTYKKVEEEFIKASKKQFRKVQFRPLSYYTGNPLACGVWATTNVDIQFDELDLLVDSMRKLNMHVVLRTGRTAVEVIGEFDPVKVMLSGGCSICGSPTVSDPFRMVFPDASCGTTVVLCPSCSEGYRVAVRRSFQKESFWSRIWKALFGQKRQ